MSSKLGQIESHVRTGEGKNLSFLKVADDLQQHGRVKCNENALLQSLIRSGARLAVNERKLADFEHGQILFHRPYGCIGRQGCRSAL
ncbi:hypothetical protein ACVLD2_002565 [Paenibacillus sp. PvR052]